MIILVRHGQTAPNAAGLLLGRADPGLTGLGQRQAAATAAAVAGATRIVSSPLQRCRETASLLGLGLPVEIDDRWIEIDYGSLEGCPLGDVPADVWARWRREPDWAPASGESLVDVAGRVAAACHDIVADAAVSDVVVVSHVSPIKAAVAWALDVGASTSWRMFLGVAAVSRITIGPNGPSLRSFNDTAHLASVSGGDA